MARSAVQREGRTERPHFCYRSSRFSKPSMRYLILLVGLLTPSLLAQRTQVPEIRYQSVPGFLKLPPDTYLGEVAGVAVNSKGHVFVLSRGNSTGPAYGASAAQLLEFAADGKFLREIGRNLYAWSFAHSVKIDKDDNIWVADKGSDMVIKFTPEGRVAMVFGRKQEESDESTAPLKHLKPPLPAVEGMFRQVTDVAWDSSGNAYISDGYINSRVPKVDKNGNWVTSWGEPGREPGAKPAIGNKPPSPITGNQAQAPGAPWAICITPPPHQILYSSDGYPGRIYKLTLDCKVLGVLGESGKQPKQFGWIHEMACPSENVLFVAELLNWRVQKLILHP